MIPAEPPMHGKPAAQARRRRFLIAWLLVQTGLYLPFGWLLLGPYPWDQYHLQWLRLWPVLPGLIAGVPFHHEADALEFMAMAVGTVLLVAALSGLGRLGRAGLIAALIAALGAGSLTSIAARSLYLF